MAWGNSKIFMAFLEDAFENAAAFALHTDTKHGKLVLHCNF